MTFLRVCFSLLFLFNNSFLWDIPKLLVQTMAKSLKYSYSNPHIAFAKFCLQFACGEVQIFNISLPCIKVEDGK